MVELLRKGFLSLGISYTDEMLNQFKVYYELLVDWNEKMNLTAITEKQDVAIKHFIDCATCLKHINLTGTVIDVGTGAGFPGLVLKILKPEIKICLLDSLNKRISFLDEVVKNLGLNDVTTVHLRAEDGAQNKDYREKFDFCVSRAVANLSTLSEYCLPFVKVGGMFVSMKGPDVKEELDLARSAIGTLGGQVLDVEFENLLETDINHTIIKIKKVRPTPTKYPRKAGKPSKEPLK